MAWNPDRDPPGVTGDEAGAEPAPAKINLDLLVTARRLDGYHELDSIVVFAPLGDRVWFVPAKGTGQELTLEAFGPFAAEVPVDGGNLVLEAARLFAARTGAHVAGRLVLDKRLPVGAGLGGGSADAAATLRLLDRICATGLGQARLREIGAELGADVPVCVYGKTARMRGLGERLDPLRGLPDLALVLVHPGVHVATPAVFRGLETLGAERDIGIQPHGGPRFLAPYLAASRNDLEAPALTVAPVIGKVLACLRVLEGCQLARMSGSGSACFGLFAEPVQAERAAGILRLAAPNWWIQAVTVPSDLSAS